MAEPKRSELRSREPRDAITLPDSLPRILPVVRLGGIRGYCIHFRLGPIAAYQVLAMIS